MQRVEITEKSYSYVDDKVESQASRPVSKNCPNCGAPLPEIGPCLYCGPIQKCTHKRARPHLTTNYVKVGTNLLLTVVSLLICWYMFSKKQETKPKQESRQQVATVYVPVQTPPSLPRPEDIDEAEKRGRECKERELKERLDDIEAERKEVLLKKQAAEMDFVASMQVKKETGISDQPTETDVQQKVVQTQIPINPEREAKVKKVQDLQSLIEKQTAILQTIKGGGIPCEQCGRGIHDNCVLTKEHSLKTETTWKCWSCDKIYSKTQQGTPVGNFVYVPRGQNMKTPKDRQERESYQEIIYRQQSLVLDDLKKQLDKAEKNLAGIPLLSDAPPAPPPPAEPKPRRFYVLQDREVEVVSEVETGQEIVIKTPNGEFIVIKRKDIREVVTK